MTKPPGGRVSQDTRCSCRRSGHLNDAFLSPRRRSLSTAGSEPSRAYARCWSLSTMQPARLMQLRFVPSESTSALCGLAAPMHNATL